MRHSICSNGTGDGQTHRIRVEIESACDIDEGLLQLYFANKIISARHAKRESISGYFLGKTGLGFINSE